MKYWITTHWPMPEEDDPFVRHVYVKSHHVRYPSRGDIVFVRESLTVRGSVRTSAVRCNRGERVTVRLPRGIGDLIGGMSVTADRPRSFEPDDVVYDFGDLSEWSRIDCTGFQRFHETLPHDELMVTLGYRPDTPPRFLDLWRVPEEVSLRLLRKLGR